MQKKRFAMNAVLLTLTGLLTRLIGVIFRIYISNKIGTQGIGVYQLILTVYMFTTTFATSGITLAVTRLVTDSIASGKAELVSPTVKRFQLAGIGVSTFVCLVLYMCAQPVGVYILGDERTVLALRVLAPSLPFMAISSCYRGYFYARRAVMKTASEQLIEQIIEIVIFSIVSTPLIGKGIAYACAALAIGTTLSEVASCLYSYILYRIDVRKLVSNSDTHSDGKIPHLLQQALYIALPVTGSSCLRSGLSLIENTLIPYGLRRYGADSVRALSDYGMITGMVMPVITFPAVFLFAFSMLMIPEMSEAKASVRTNGISHMGNRILQFTFMFTIPTSVILLIFSQDIGELIYGNPEVGFYIGVIAPIIPLTYLDTVVDGMLKGLNEQVHYLAYNIIDSTVRVVLTFILIPKYGIKGVVIVMFVSAILNSGLSLLRLIKVAKLKIEFISWILKPIICAFTAAFIARTCNNTVISIVLSAIGYYLLMRIMGTITKKDINWAISIIK